jgi:hypothetical protein
MPENNFTIHSAGRVPKAAIQRGQFMIESFFGQKVVMDLRSSFVCLGTLVGTNEQFLELKNADVHDLRDTQTSRENYIAASVATGIKRNRKHVLINRDDLVAISLLADFVDD